VRKVPAAAAAAAAAGAVRRGRRTAMRTVAADLPLPKETPRTDGRRRHRRRWCVRLLHGRPQRRAPAAVVRRMKAVWPKPRHGQLGGVQGLHVLHVAVRAAGLLPGRAAPGWAERAGTHAPNGGGHAAGVRAAAAALRGQHQLEVPPPQGVNGGSGQGGGVGSLILAVQASAVNGSVGAARAGSRGGCCHLGM